MESKKTIRSPLTLQELLESGRPSKELESIIEEVLEQERSTPINEARYKRDRIWSMLANQAVGAEHLPDQTT